MKPEPEIDRQQLLDTIRQMYGIDAERLDFVPTGFVSTSYRVTGRTAGSLMPPQYFLKVWNQSRLGKISAGRLDFTLALTGRLEQMGFNVPRVIRARSGVRKIQAGALTLVLYEYLAGRMLEVKEVYSAAVLPELARTVARLHNSTSALGMVIPDVERFETPFVEALLSGLAKLAELSPGARPGQKELRALLLPEQPRVLRNIERMRALGAAARACQPEFVLCHTDLHGLNLIRVDGGALYLLDWEGAMLAPPEHDLFMFSGASFPVFLSAYRAVYGQTALQSVTFGFYFYRRSLEDLTDYLVTILEENVDDRQDADDLEGVREIVAGWPGLEARIAQVESQIGSPK